jgi:DNA-binding SARP family transcriptional activator
MEASAPRLGIEVLGTLNVRIDNAEIALGSTKQRRLLALLLMRPNRAVSVNELIDAVWNENPPRTARKNLQVYVCGLRKLLAMRIEHGPDGYVFRSDADEVDLLRFDELVAAGRRAARNGDVAASADLLGQAVRLWRGKPAAGLWEPDREPADAARLWERFVSAYEDWIDATIAGGQYVEALENLDSMDGAIAFRERLTVSRIRALSQCGRTLEALAFYETKRQYLAREYGIDPSPMLQTIYLSLISPETNGGQVMFSDTPPQPHAATHQLPRKIPDLIGRDEPLHEILRTPAGVKVVWGRIGAGKTSLAIHAAHLAAADYPDGNLFVRSHTPDGEPKDGGSAVRELLGAVGLSAAAPADPEAAVALWRSWTSDRKILLVLDDVPDEDYADAVLPTSAESLVIITSRSRLSGLEADRWIELGDFTEREATQLLTRLIGEPRMEHDGSAVAKIMDCCGSSPLAIRMIGSKLAALPHLSLTEFAERLAAGDPFTELASGQASVEARYAQWYEGLPEESKAAARCLADLSSGPFTHIEACQALAFEGHSPDRAFETLLELSMLSTSQAFDEVTAHAVADVTLHAEMYEIPPLMRRFLLRPDGQA